MSSFPLSRGGRAVACAIARALAAAVLAWALPAAATEPLGVGPSVRDVVQFTRIVLPRNSDAGELQRQVAPDGRRAYVVTRTADVAANVNRYSILLLDLEPQRLATMQTPAPRVLATLEASDDNDAAHPALQDVRWANGRTLVLRYRPRGLAYQVYQLDVQTGRLTQLTFAPLGVAAYALSLDLRRVVYASPHDNPPLGPGEFSVVVGNRSFWSVVHGQNDRRAQQRMFRVFVAEAGRRSPARPLGEAAAEANRTPPVVDISPDGRWALVARFETARQLEWAQSYPLVRASMERYLSGLTVDPLGYFTRPVAYVPRRFVAYRLADGAEQLVIDAPDDSLSGPGQARSDRLWMDGGRSVVLGGTHLPPPADLAHGAALETATASHLVEYWPDSGAWKVIAPLRGRLEGLRQEADDTQSFVATDGGTPRRFTRTADGSWQEGEPSAAPSPTLQAGWTLRIAEGLDTPPDVVAVGPEGQTIPLTRLNPQFDSAWGSVRTLRWTDAQGRVWEGGLMVPSGYQPSRRQPVVIQTYGFDPQRFYLDGSNLVDGFTSGFAGRAFLREGLLVVAMPIRASNGWPDTDMAAMVATTQGVQGLIQTLVDEGIADRDRIGIMGWSATGERVLHTLTFSDAPLRSASILDGDANTLFSYTVTYGASDTILARKERTNGGPPFGPTLQTWLRNDPALHTDCIRAALRIETYGPWAKNNWDLHALLRRQLKPAEMVVIPGGSHALLVPQERMISLQGNVDWHRFWLTGGQRSQPVLQGETLDKLRAQYARWRQMEQLKQADDARPRCEQWQHGPG